MKVKSTLARVVENVLLWSIPILASFVIWRLSGDYPDTEFWSGGAFLAVLVGFSLFVVAPLKYFLQLGMPVRVLGVLGGLNSGTRHGFFDDNNKLCS